MRNYGHDLRRLLERADEIAGRLGEEYRLPRTPIHEGIIDVLNDFAKNITRYYNLDIVTEAPRVRGRSDPLREWFDRVISPVAEKHYRPARREADRMRAEAFGRMMGTSIKVIHTSERGDTMTDLSSASTQTALVRAAQPWVRMYVLQIARFLGVMLSDLGRAPLHESVPYLGDFFAIFNNDDAYLRSRQTWSIYKLR